MPQPHEERVIAELSALEEKVRALYGFIEDPGTLFAGLPEVERSDLVEQYKHMDDYAHVLKRRISRF